MSQVGIAVLDEADKVTEGVFFETVSRILAALPSRKQLLASYLEDVQRDYQMV